MSKKYLPYLILAALAVAIPLTYLLTQTRQEIRQKAVPNTSLSAIPVSPAVVNQSVNLNVNINTGSNAVAGAEIHLDFNPALLRANSVNLPTQPFLSTIIPQATVIDNTNGKVTFIIYNGDPVLPGITGIGTLATVTFTALQTTANTTVSFNPATNIAAVSEPNLNVLTGTLPASFPISLFAASPSPQVSASPYPSSSPGATVSPNPSTSPYPSTSPLLNCIAVQGTVFVTPPGGAGTCHDIQEAINAAPIVDGIVKLAPGTYVVPQTGQDYDLKVINRTNFILRGDPPSGSRAVRLEFSGNGYGILFENTSGSLEWMDINSQKIGLTVGVNYSHNFNIGFLHLNTTGYTGISFYSGQNNSIYNSEISAYASGNSLNMALNFGNETNFNLSNNTIRDSKTGIYVFRSVGTIQFNLIFGQIYHPLQFTGDNNLWLYKNTIVYNQALDANLPGTIWIDNTTNPALSRYLIENNIVAFNQGAGIDVQNSANAFINLIRNDFYSNQPNYRGISDQTGLNNNISADPLFGVDYCLIPGSPAIYGNPFIDYMGARGQCGDTFPSPLPSSSPGASASPFPSTSPLPSATPTPPTTPAVFTVKVHFQGVNAKRPDKNIDLTLINSNNPLSWYNRTQVNMVADNSGIYTSETITDIAPGIYDIFVKGPVHLVKKFPQVNLNPGMQTLNFATANLLAGDIYGTGNATANEVDPYDYSQLLTDFGPRMPPGGSIADLDFDGQVFTLDYTIMVANYGKHGDIVPLLAIP